jgi:putative SOS response-associated peptidase YedK
VCGRIALYTPPERLARLLGAELAAGVDPEGRPSWNVTPQQTLFGLTEQPERVLAAYRWGLVPSWAKDPKIGGRLFNARGETVAEKPSFRTAFAKRPCVVPVDGFYEWDRRGATKQPHFFTRTDQQPLLLAGLYERPRENDAPGASLGTCTVITTTPNDDIDGIHDRMPVVLEMDEIDLWLDIDSAVAAVRLAALDPAPKGTLTHLAVSTRVGNVRNNGPELIAPAGDES